MVTPNLPAGGPADAGPRSPRHIELDGRTLEGGGQLVRIAIALSALTSQPVTVNHVRGRRHGSRGVKASHAAAVKLLADISGSEVTGGHVGSQSVTFRPTVASQSISDDLTQLVSLSDLNVKSDYNIRLPTPGSALLIFQALYPYMLHVGSRAPAECINVTITGGTNGTSAPSYDYAAQVMAPNFARLGLPSLSLTLHKRGWTSGPVDMGTLSFAIHPLSSLNRNAGKESEIGIFPPIRIMDHERGKITNIDITILAPDFQLPAESKTVRAYMEKATKKSLRRALKTMDPSIFELVPGDSDEPSNQTLVPVQIHTSEQTAHKSRIYVLVVAHTSTGFKIGHDALIGSEKGRPVNKSSKKGPRKNKDDGSAVDISKVDSLIDACIEGFINEISNENLDLKGDEAAPVRRPCVDTHMRDQIVVFEALGEACRGQILEQAQLEDTRYSSLHTQTAQWVCRQMLGTYQKQEAQEGK